jgi:diacylglycerol kinase family enzyme
MPRWGVTPATTTGGERGGGGAPPPGSRLSALAALVVLAASLALLVVFSVRHLGYLLVTVVAAVLAVAALWVALTNRRWRWPAGLAAGALLVGTVAALLAGGSALPVIIAVVGGMALSGVLGTVALRHEVHRAVDERWHPVPAAGRPVLLMNPRSGGGKVERNHLPAEAARRGIEGIVLGPDDDLRAVAEQAASRGTDVLGMAGGDGSLAIVASVAAEHGLAFVCVPAGTRNHLALDLGVDRDDVVGSLDAFGPAFETSIDLATVNGRVFVNNVSLGLYAEIVASDEYRDAKVKTTAQVLQELMGSDVPPFDLHLEGPAGEIDRPLLVQISNNPYLLTSLGGFGTRPRLDAGTLGIVTARVDGPADLQRLATLEAVGRAARFTGVQSWTAPSVHVHSSSSVAAGIDGEACALEPPLQFESVPNALRVRIAPGHPGASPAMTRAPLGASTVVGLWALARGRPSGLVG